MDTQREEYLVRWVTSLLKRSSRSGLDKITIQQVWDHCKSPMIDGVMMPDALLHRFNRVEAFEVILRRFQMEGDFLLIPEDIQVRPRQEITQSHTPVSNRKLFAEKMSAAADINYFDPYIGTDWLAVFNTILGFISENKLKKLNLLTTKAKLEGTLQKKAFADTIKMFNDEYGIAIEVRLMNEKEHPRFFMANGKIWKVGHSLSHPDKFEGLDEMVERKKEWEKFWAQEWSSATPMK